MVIQMRKKAQTASQIFIYIMSMLIVLLILVYGYKAISGFNKQSDTIVLAEFKTSITGVVDEVRAEWGSVRTREIRVPSEYEGVCFVVPDTSIAENVFEDALNLDSNLPNLGINLVVDSATEEGSRDNVFLVGSSIQPFFLGDDESGSSYIDVPGDQGDPQALCMDAVGGKIKIRVTGKGKKAYIEKLN